MDKDRVKGKVRDISGRVKRQAGEWTGNEQAQAEGAAEQLGGKAQQAWGEAKDAARDARDEAEKKVRDIRSGMRQHQPERREGELEVEQEEPRRRKTG